MNTFKYIIKDSHQLATFIIVSLACWTFIELASLVTSETTIAIDEQLVLFFREDGDLSDPIGPKWVEEMMRDITALGGVGILVIVSLLATILLAISNHPRAAMLVVVGIASGMLVSFSLKYGFSRPRPDLVPHGSYVYTSSFPSGHAMMSALVYFTIAGLLSLQQTKKRLKSFYFLTASVLTIAIGISRVYLGVHYPSDILAGWLVGCSWALLIYFVYRWSRMKRNYLATEPD